MERIRYHSKYYSLNAGSVFSNKLFHFIIECGILDVRTDKNGGKTMDKIYEQLLDKASQAAQKAWNKYSHFCVGAALLTQDGKFFTGCNIENSSYSLTVCAERTAIFKAVSEGCTAFSAIAVVGGDMVKPCYPCGACLQVMSEFCDADFKVILTDGVHRFGDLLPSRFELDR